MKILSSCRRYMHCRNVDTPSHSSNAGEKPNKTALMQICYCPNTDAMARLNAQTKGAGVPPGSSVSVAGGQNRVRGIPYMMPLAKVPSSMG